MLKHKREEFLSDSSHRALIVSGLIFACAVVDIVMVYRKPGGYFDGMGLLVPAVLFAALSVFLLLRGILKAGKRKGIAMQSRRNYLQNGVVSHGKISSAGGGYYQKGHYRQQHIRHEKPRHFRVWENRWWAEIEYYDETKGIYARYRAIDLNRSAKRYVGKDVDIYRLDESVYADFK